MPELLSGATAAIGAVGKIAGNIAGIGPVKAWLHGCKTRVVAGRLMPRNHDLVKGVRTAHLCALDHVTRCYTKLLTTLPDHEIGSDDHAFASNLRVFIDERLTLLNDKNIDHDVLTADDIDHVLEHLTHAATHESYAELSDEAQEGCETGALKEIADDAGRQPPALFVRIFKGEHGNAGWYEAFSLFVTEELKTNERFRSIFFSTKLGDIGRTLDELSNRTLKDFPDLSGFMTALKHQLDRMEAKLDRIQETVEQLVVTLAKNDELSRKLEAANVNEQKVMAIARRTALNINDFDQALAELESHAEIAIEVEREGRGGSNLGDFVDAVLARVREKYDANDFDAAAAEADKGFVEWEKQEAERRDEALQAGLKILETGLKQDILRRSASSAAKRILRMSEIQHPHNRSKMFTTLAGAFNEWFESGRDQGLNFDLEIAIEIASLGLVASSGEEERRPWLNSLGIAQQTLGSRKSTKTDLEDAVATYLSALNECNREKQTHDWTMIQNNLGNALYQLSYREKGTKYLEEAVSAYLSALEELGQHHNRIMWAQTQNNLGNALAKLAERESGNARFKQAATAYRSVLKEYNRGKMPLEWALAQNNLGNALSSLGDREQDNQSRITYFEQAIIAYRLALQEYTQDNTPLDWAMTHNNLGNVLSALGSTKSDTERFEEAVAAYRLALKGYKQERVPLDWAMTQYNLGNTLLKIGVCKNNILALEEAVAAYHSALEERKQNDLPVQWASTFGNQGIALRFIAQLTLDPTKARQALGQIETAFETFRQAGHGTYADYFKDEKQKALGLVAKLGEH